MRAELIVENAQVLTMDPRRPRAEAVAIGAGRILAVGDRAEVAALAAPGATAIDARGGTVTPGFVEAHMHLFLGAFELDHLQLGGVEGAGALAAAVRAFAAARPDAPVVMAQGARYDVLGPGRRLTRADLDALVPDRPAAVVAADHHTVWANTAALAAAGLLRGRATPPGHEVVMGPDGLATGELREIAAFEPVMALAGGGRVREGLATGLEPRPAPTPAERAFDRAMLRRGLAHCAELGITSIHNMDGNRYLLALLSEIEAEGGLTARVRVPFHLKPDMDLGMLDRAEAMTRDFRSDRLASGFVKVFLDGVLESWTAAMVDDYADRPGERGALLFAPEAFRAAAIEADRRGLQVAVHAVGDRAVRTALDGFEAARAANGARDARHRIEHIEVLHPDDAPRFARLGVVASMQPLHRPDPLTGEMEPIRSALGPARWPWACPTDTLRRAGARIAFSSDWPVSPLDPLVSIRAAVRRTPWADGVPAQRSTLGQALAHYTADGAWCGHMERLVGRIAPGLRADLAVLDGPLADLIRDEPGPSPRVRATLFDGRVAFGG